MKTITVAELITALQSMNCPNSLVAIAADCAGNGYSLMPNEQFMWEAFAEPRLGDADIHEKQTAGTVPVLVLFGSN